MDDTRKAWWKDAAERLVWTFIQGALGVPIGAEIYEVITDQAVAVPTLFLMLSGGVGAVLSLIKSTAASKLSAGDTAQLGARTYSYTEAGPGAAGGDI